MKFMLLMNAPRGNGDWNVSSWPIEDVKAHVQHMKDLYREISDAGELVGAEGLAPPGQARIVRAGKSGTPEVTDGPYPEGKEFLAGYFIVDVESAARGYEIAARMSAAPGKGGKPMNMAVEVREVGTAPEV
jgi:hypothetical protein